VRAQRKLRLRPTSRLKVIMRMRLNMIMRMRETRVMEVMRETREMYVIRQRRSSSRPPDQPSGAVYMRCTVKQGCCLSDPESSKDHTAAPDVLCFRTGLPCCGEDFINKHTC
jgi:hypothetical protein